MATNSSNWEDVAKNRYHFELNINDKECKKKAVYKTNNTLLIFDRRILDGQLATVTDTTV